MNACVVSAASTVAYQNLEFVMGNDPRTGGSWLQGALNHINVYNTKLLD